MNDIDYEIEGLRKAVTIADECLRGILPTEQWVGWKIRNLICHKICELERDLISAEDFQTLKSLILSINEVCPSYGTVNVGWIEIGGQKLKPITIAGNGIKREGETVDSIYASVKLACDAALQAFKEIHQSCGNPGSMLWRMKPQICSYVVGEGSTYYAVKMRVVFLD